MTIGMTVLVKVSTELSVVVTVSLVSCLLVLVMVVVSWMARVWLSPWYVIVGLKVKLLTSPSTTRLLNPNPSSPPMPSSAGRMGKKLGLLCLGRYLLGLL